MDVTMETQKPNVLLLFTDMQRSDTIHALGNSVIKTPNLDRLVNQGTSFTNCFTPSPVCIPARCCMHYGFYPQKTGLFKNGRMMDDNEKSFVEILGKNGYKTHGIGKCHFTPDGSALRGFGSRESQEECTADPESDDYIKWLKDNGHDYYEAHGARGDMYYIPQVSTLPAELHPTQWIGDRSVKYIDDAAQSEQPWFLFGSFIHPHPPFAPPKPWHKLYRVPDMPLPFAPDNSEELYTWINRIQNRYKYRDRGIDGNLLRAIKAYYYASISFVDFQVGRILDKLEETGQLDNTLILFTSDHGEHLGDLNCFGKRSMHDASSKVPMIARYPKGFAPGSQCSTATSLCDVYPTIMDACNIPSGELGLDGVDMSKTASEGDSDRIVYSQYGENADAIYMAVNTNWKYVYSAGDDREFLFDRIKDQAEVNNLASLSDFDCQKINLRQNLFSYLKSVGATDVIEETEGSSAWKKFPKYDLGELDNPDARLLIQDYPSYEMDLPGYSD